MTSFFKILLIFILGIKLSAQNNPVEFIYKQQDNTTLKAYIFFPDQMRKESLNSAIVIFHGGGWALGEPSWSFSKAKHFAKLRLIAIAAQYRLSDQKNITPLDAIEDAKDLIKWTRANNISLKIDPEKIIGYGWSAGAHLVVSSAISDSSTNEASSSPNALILVSPAVSLANDNWFKKLLLNKIDASKVSPDMNVKKGMPPTLILQGSDDTVTPLTCAKNFTREMKQKGNICELIIYNKVGHLFTPSTERDDGSPNPDLKVLSKANKKADDFLRKLGYIK